MIGSISFNFWCNDVWNCSLSTVWRLIERMYGLIFLFCRFGELDFCSGAGDKREKPMRTLIDSPIIFALTVAGFVSLVGISTCFIFDLTDFFVVIFLLVCVTLSGDGSQPSCLWQLGCTSFWYFLPFLLFRHES